VPGRLADVTSVTVDIGTGYYVEMAVPAARAFYQRKETYLQENLRQLAATITAKRKNLQGPLAPPPTPLL
jgi:prefoldin subunit 5